MKKDKKLVIFGAGETADIAYEYFTRDSPYEVVAFAVEAQYRTATEHYGLPVLTFEEMQERYPPAVVEAFVAISYVKLNRIRAKCYRLVTEAGYTCATYISSKAFVWSTATVADNCMIFENNVIQHGVRIDRGVILWSGNHVGHQTHIEEFAYLSSHVVVSGFCVIGAYSFLGVNATFNDNIKLGPNTIVGSGSLVVKNAEGGLLLMGSPAKPAAKTSFEAFGVTETDLVA